MDRLCEGVHHRLSCAHICFDFLSLGVGGRWGSVRSSQLLLDVETSIRGVGASLLWELTMEKLSDLGHLEQRRPCHSQPHRWARSHFLLPTSHLCVNTSGFLPGALTLLSLVLWRDVLWFCLASICLVLLVMDNAKTFKNKNETRKKITTHLFSLFWWIIRI